ncbi:MAG: DNA-binding MarR family transcriptional regulator, partial [Litorivivens sp.]
KMDADKRSVWLAVTAEGLEKIETSPEILQSEFLAKYRKLETWERQMLVASLSRIASMMNAEGIDASPILTSGEIGKS